MLLRRPRRATIRGFQSAYSMRLNGGGALVPFGPGKWGLLALLVYLPTPAIGYVAGHSGSGCLQFVKVARPGIFE